MDDMTLGYMDGLKPDSPTPSMNRSGAYHHGFGNGRDDLKSKPRASAKVLRFRSKEISDKEGNADG